ncbi:hypothetical protein A605_07140 [Corynebacterium halotolerans YIM 70093 = DSM 44683]|uniref:Thioesterase domain-containing protein n=2 Tax=Corynebacterium halotolerans TaxID=225326 RepID=M1NY54_9CORY|nr:hypothetical protein A605_07140 [Corynebacterium halotolerans YIM 70093 = DSM 44683]
MGGGTLSPMELMDLITRAASSEQGLDAAGLADFNAANTGLDAHLGIRYTHLAADRVTAELPVTEQLLQPVGLVNGGVYCSLAESLGSMAGVAAAGGRPVVGVNNNTDFIASVRAGIIEAEATPVQVGRRTQIWQIRMTHRGKLVARSTLRTMVL